MDAKLFQMLEQLLEDETDTTDLEAEFSMEESFMTEALHLEQLRRYQEEEARFRDCGLYREGEIPPMEGAWPSFSLGHDRENDLSKAFRSGEMHLMARPALGGNLPKRSKA